MHLTDRLYNCTQTSSPFGPEPNSISVCLPACLRASHTHSLSCARAQNYVSLSALQMVHDLRRQFVRALHTASFVPAAVATGTEPLVNVSAGQRALVRAALFAGLYPNVARMQRPRTGASPSLIPAHTQTHTDTQIQSR
jgi:hypothetical protein